MYSYGGKAMERKFYETDWFMWLMLFFVAPVGIFLLWKYKRFNPKVRIILSIVFSVFFIFMMITAQIDEARKIESEKQEAIKIEAQKKADEEKKKIEDEKKRLEELNKPSEFEGITIGQKEKLKDFIQGEAKKSINKEGTFADTWKIFQEGELYTLMFSYITKERSVDVDNRFVASVNWDGISDKLEMENITSNPVIILGTDHFVKLTTIAEDAVKANLKAPSTAKFPGVILDADQWSFKATFKGTSDGNVLYQIQSYVDAQNSFGAMLRSNFVVTVEINWNTKDYLIKSVKID